MAKAETKKKSADKKPKKERVAVDRNRFYPLDEAVSILKAAAKVRKFDETIEIAINLSVDTKHADQPVLDFPGPYGYWYHNDWSYIIDDVNRMNLFHKAEIHCIGIGEASQGLLYGIAKAGMGQVKMVGG